MPSLSQTLAILRRGFSSAAYLFDALHDSLLLLLALREVLLLPALLDFVSLLPELLDPALDRLHVLEALRTQGTGKGNQMQHTSEGRICSAHY